MEFGSLEELKAYVESCIAKSMSECAKEQKKIMEEVTREQVGGISGDMFNSPQITNVTKDSCETEFMDNGGWTSLVGKNKGNHFFAMYGLEGGYTWNRGATSLMDTSSHRIESQIPLVYLRIMLGLGIPIG